MRVLLSLALLLIASVAHAQPDVKIRLHDETVLMGILQQKEVPFITKHGTLKISTADIRRIGFGLHYEEGEMDAIKAKVRELNSDVYKTREEAGKFLILKGKYSSQFLRGTNFSKEQQVRIGEIQEKIKESMPNGFFEKDILYTEESMIQGQVNVPSFLIKHKELGELSIKPRSIAYIDFVSAVKELSVGITPDWVDTGITLNRDDKVTIEASGDIDMYSQQPGTFKGTPGGSAWPGMISNHKAGTLLFRVGTNEVQNGSGNRTHNNAFAGKLYLYVNPPPWPESQPVGAYTVKIRVH